MESTKIIPNRFKAGSQIEEGTIDWLGGLDSCVLTLEKIVTTLKRQIESGQVNLCVLSFLGKQLSNLGNDFNQTINIADQTGQFNYAVNRLPNFRPELIKFNDQQFLRNK